MDAAQRLEHDLGDPEDGRLPFSYARRAELTDTNDFPHDICLRLDDLGMSGHYVPARHGGRLVSYETTAQMVRMLARRDLGVAVAHAKTYLGGVCVWVAGKQSQAIALGRMISAGVPVSWGLTERDHGSDLLGGELVAERISGPSGISYRLRGEKWPINNATRAGVVCVLARTDPAGGPRGFSLFLVNKTELKPGSYQCLPKVPTLGNRSADISGIVFSGAVVGADSLVGAEGTGVENVLKGLQVTRTLCAALSLGSGDHALRIATEFLLGHKRHGRHLIDDPAARRIVATAYADHLLSEALSVVAFRAIHALTPELAVIAAVTKYLVPTRTEAAIASLRRLIGPSALLCDGHGVGRIGKVESDHRVVSLFDGNTVVNLHSLINLFPLLARAHDRKLPPDSEGLRTACDLARPLPEARLGRLSLIPRNGVSLLLTAGSSITEVAALARKNPALKPVADAADRLRGVLDEMWAEIDRQQPTRMDVPKQSFLLAKRVAIGLAGVAAVELWLRNQVAVPAEGSPEDPLWRDGLWLHAVLRRVLVAAGDQHDGTDPCHDLLLGVLVDQVNSGRLPSLFACQLADTPPSGADREFAAQSIGPASGIARDEERDES